MPQWVPPPTLVNTLRTFFVTRKGTNVIEILQSSNWSRANQTGWRLQDDGFAYFFGWTQLGPGDSTLILDEYGLSIYGANIVLFDELGALAHALIARRTTIQGITFNPGDSFNGHLGTAADPGINLYFTQLGMDIRSYINTILRFRGDRGSIEGLMSIGPQFGASILFGAGRFFAVRNAAGEDGVFFQVGTDADPNYLYCRLGWPDPYQPHIILTNQALRIDAEALVGSLPLDVLNVTYLSEISDQAGYLTQLNMQNYPIDDVGDPLDDTDAINKGYADSHLQGRTLITDEAVDGQTVRWDDAADQWEPGWSTPPPSQEGQVLYSLDGVTFTAQLPVTTEEDGWLVNEEGLLIVAG